MNKSVEIKRDKNDVIIIDNGNELSGDFGCRNKLNLNVYFMEGLE